MASIGKALRRVFKILRVVGDIASRVTSIENTLDRLEQATDFFIDSDLHRRRVEALESIARELDELAPYSEADGIGDLLELGGAALADGPDASGGDDGEDQAVGE